MKHFALIALALALAGVAAAQATGMSGYNKMKIDHAGQITGNLSGAIEEMSGGVRIVLLSDDEAKGNLPIAADKITFAWGEGSQPKSIILTGNVRIQHPDADVTAEKAEWDFGSGQLVFTGNPVMNSPRAQNMKGDKMTFNMQKGTFAVTGVSISELPLNEMGGLGGAGGGAGLTEGDVSDWPGLVNALKAGGGPASHITGMIDPENRKRLMETPTDLVVENKGVLIKQINTLMQAPAFYSAEAWSGIALPEGVAEKLASRDLEASERVEVNKTAFKAAFPAFMN